MRLLRSRPDQYSARGPVPPWWRRPGVLAVVGLLVVGGALTASAGVVGLVSSREVRETTAVVRRVPLPDGLTEWAAACGIYGLRCARSAEPPEAAVEAFASLLRESGHDVAPARCGVEADVPLGTTLAAVPRHESQCTTTTSVRGGRLTLAAWDHLPTDDGALDLGVTAFVVEWDSQGTELLLEAEPGLAEERFADERITADEVAALPGELARLECDAYDDDGCMVWRGTLGGPGEGRALLEAWARELLDAGILVTQFDCPEGDGLTCGLSANAGRGDGEATLLGVRLDVDGESRSLVRASAFPA